MTTEELLNNNAAASFALRIRYFFEDIGDFFEALWDRITAFFGK